VRRMAALVLGITRAHFIEESGEAASKSGGAGFGGALARDVGRSVNRVPNECGQRTLDLVHTQGGITGVRDDSKRRFHANARENLDRGARGVKHRHNRPLDCYCRIQLAGGVVRLGAPEDQDSRCVT
jgi:hypothetical protein